MRRAQAGGTVTGQLKVLSLLAIGALHVTSIPKWPLPLLPIMVVLLLQFATAAWEKGKVLQGMISSFE